MYYLILLISMISIMCVSILCFLCAMQMNSSHPNEKVSSDYKAFSIMCVSILCFLCAMQMNSSHPNEKVDSDYKAFTLFQNFLSAYMYFNIFPFRNVDELVEIVSLVPVYY